MPLGDVVESALEAVEGQTFCPYKGLASLYNIGDHKRAAWSYLNAWPEVGRVSNLVSFEPDKIDVCLDGKQLHLEPGKTVISSRRRPRTRPRRNPAENARLGVER